MKTFFKIAIALCVVGLLSVSPAWAGGTFRIGGGVYFDETVPGGHLSIDIPVGGGKFAISPFADIFSKDILKIYGGGVNIMLKREAGEKSTVYFGAGGGVASVDVAKAGSKTQSMGNAVVGLEFSVGEKASIFVQGKWIGTFGDYELRNFAGQAGVSFSFGE